MTSFLPQCRRTIQPRQTSSFKETCQPSSETAAGLIFLDAQTACFFRWVEIKTYNANHVIQ